MLSVFVSATVWGMDKKPKAFLKAKEIQIFTTAATQLRQKEFDWKSLTTDETNALSDFTIAYINQQVVHDPGYACAFLGINYQKVIANPQTRKQAIATFAIALNQNTQDYYDLFLSGVNVLDIITPKVLQKFQPEDLFIARCDQLKLSAEDRSEMLKKMRSRYKTGKRSDKAIKQDATVSIPEVIVPVINEPLNQEIIITDINPVSAKMPQDQLVSHVVGDISAIEQEGKPEIQISYDKKRFYIPHLAASFVGLSYFGFRNSINAGFSAFWDSMHKAIPVLPTLLSAITITGGTFYLSKMIANWNYKNLKK